MFAGFTLTKALISAFKIALELLSRGKSFLVRQGLRKENIITRQNNILPV